MSNAAKSPFLQHAEILIKIGTATVALLFVSGLIISNAQLMALGIADFGALQTRNVMIGLLYYFYFALLATIVAPIATVIAMLVLDLISSNQLVKSRLIRLIGYAVLAEAFILISAGSIVGYLLPWGLSWSQQWSFSPYSYYSNISQILTQAHDIYFRSKVVASSFSLILLETAAILIFLVKRRRLAEVSEIEKYRFLIFVFAFYAGASILIFLLFDYADEVYPNIKYNLGGGQPQIANLTLSGKHSELAGLEQSVGFSHRLCCHEPNNKADKPASDAKDPVDRDEAISIVDVAIWYQSDKFLYVGSEGIQTKSRVVAIDLKLVRAIHYLPKYAKVVSGARIINIRSH